MRIKFFTLVLILLGLSLNTQAQNVTSKKTVHVNQTEQKEQLSTAKSKISKEKRDNLRRRNMAKYKAMTKKTESTEPKIEKNREDLKL